jgi:hypothetical protein
MASESLSLPHDGVTIARTEEIGAWIPSQPAPAIA